MPAGPRDAPLRRAVPRLRERLSASQLLLVSFLALIALGCVGFRSLPDLYAGAPLGWVDALFMATSAVCVTGLSVVDVSQHFTGWGQAWLLLLIQAGGLGMLTFAGVVTSLVGRRSRLALEEAAGGPASVLPSSSPIALLRLAVGVTLACEALGAAALWAAWRDRFPPGEALWHAVFHAVSAFCNAGFSLFSDSLVGFRASPAPLLVAATLIVVGGLGFPVLQDLRMRALRRHDRLTLHSRIVLVSTGVLLLASTGAYLLFEWAHTLAPLEAPLRAVNALFMAVTARTAGFNTVDYDAISNPALFLTLGLMWVGGGAGSVAGGVKVTTVVLLGLALLARLRGEREVSIGGRTVPAETVARAAGLAAGGALLLGAVVFVLLATELPEAGADREQMVRLVFEAQSAMGTVGLSMGVTDDLSPAGRLVLVPVMLLGRVGPLAMLGAMVLRERRRPAFRYAHEDVLIG